MTSSAAPRRGERRPLQEGLFQMPEREGTPVSLTENRCLDCGEAFFPGRHYCANCSSATLERQTFGPRGVVHTFTVVHQRLPGAAVDPPYAIVVVGMDGGVSAQSVLVDADPQDVSVGMTVEAIARTVLTDEDGASLINYFFRPLARHEDSHA